MVAFDALFREYGTFGRDVELFKEAGELTKHPEAQMALDIACNICRIQDNMTNCEMREIKAKARRLSILELTGGESVHCEAEV